MNKATKIAVLIVIVCATIAALALYVTKSKQNVAQKDTQTVNTSLNQTPKVTNKSTEQLPSLPKDNKEAINSELKGIDDSIASVDNVLSNDSEDGELGL